MKLPQRFGRRLILFALGLVIMAVGVALSAKASLGTSPIASVPYVLSLALPVTLGELTFLVHGVCVLLQILLMRRRYRPLDLLQLPAAVAFGLFTDLAMDLLAFPVPESYPVQWLLCLVSILLVAMGAFLMVKANLLMLAADGLVNDLAHLTGREYGVIKISFDCSMVAISLVLSLVLMHRVEGVREGTLAAALLVGFLVRMYNRRFTAVDHFLGLTGLEVISTPAPSAEAKPHIVITISREFGSGGLAIAKALSQRMGIPIYDEELIPMAAQRAGLDVEFARKHEERLSNGFLLNLYAQSYEAFGEEAACDQLFAAQCQVIRDLADREDCIIVGRHANYILGRNPSYFHVFVHAEPKYRSEMIAQRFHISPARAMAVLQKTDAERRNHCRRYTGKAWGMATGFNLTLDTERYGAQGSADLIHEALLRYLYTDLAALDGENPSQSS